MSMRRRGSGALSERRCGRTPGRPKSRLCQRLGRWHPSSNFGGNNAVRKTPLRSTIISLGVSSQTQWAKEKRDEGDMVHIPLSGMAAVQHKVFRCQSKCIRESQCRLYATESCPAISGELRGIWTFTFILGDVGYRILGSGSGQTCSA